MTYMKMIAVAGILGGVSACGQLSREGDAPVDVAQGGNACGAADFQTLVGTSVGGLDPSSLPEPRRIIFPGQVVTQDFSAQRLNVVIGADDLVSRVYCG
jgi:hypothetical protein